MTSLLSIPDQAPCHPPGPSSSQECESPSVDPAWVMLKPLSQSQCPVGVSSMVLRVLGFLVGTVTGNKVQTLGPQLQVSFSKTIKNYQVVNKPTKTTLSNQ